MTSTKDPIFDALDRLAGVADADPVGDRMPAIARRAKTNRQRTVALTTVAVAAVAAVGYGAVSRLDLVGRAEDPGYATSPSRAVDATPSTPEPSNPEPSTPAQDPSSSSSAQAGSYTAVENVRADVDGDGTRERVSVMLPEAEAAAYDPTELVSSDNAQLVLWRDGPAFVAGMSGVVPTFDGTPDLNGDGAAEVVLGFSSGDSYSVRVYTWVADQGLVEVTVVRGEAPKELVSDSSLVSFEFDGTAVGTGIDGNELVSWMTTQPGSTQFDSWVWRLDGGVLTATPDGTRCATGTGLPEPC